MPPPKCRQLYRVYVYANISESYSSKVSYSGVVEWISPAGVYTSFREQGWKTTDNTSLVFSPLTPSTAYVFSVVVVTSDGQSEPVTQTVTTGRETGGMVLTAKCIYINQLSLSEDSACKHQW